ncbi:MAG: sugar kinase [Candidatus Riflebacteria bacterium]|nr:sugar kinase [Candidatus Riflebacteria bacterium]
MSIKIVVFGLIGYDSIETPKGKKERILGGAASYFSTVASYFTKVGLVSIVGKDFEGKYVDFLKNHGVDMAGFEQSSEGYTFNWVGSYGEDFGDATTHKNALNIFETFNPVLPESYKNAELLFIANIHPSLQIQIINQAKNPKIIALDTMNLWINTTRDTLLEAIKKVDILFVNANEAKLLAQEKRFAHAVSRLLELGPKRIVVKLGELGAMMATKETRFFVPAFPSLDVTDPTGAGDSFAGGFMGSLAKYGDYSENGFRKSMLYGSAMGSLTVENFSLETYENLDPKRIEERYQALKDMVTI